MVKRVFANEVDLMRLPHRFAPRNEHFGKSFTIAMDCIEFFLLMVDFQKNQGNPHWTFFR